MTKNECDKIIAEKPIGKNIKCLDGVWSIVNFKIENDNEKYQLRFQLAKSLENRSLGGADIAIQVSEDYYTMLQV